MQVYNDMVDSLGKVEYLHLNTHGTEHQQEVALGEFWCDLVYWNFFDRRAENRIPEAQKRSDPCRRRHIVKELDRSALK